MKRPRTVFVNFPPGRQAGRPFDPEGHAQIILGTLHLLDAATAPGTLVQLQYKWDENDPPDSWEDEEMLHPSVV